jgi:hypothetical protein
MINRIKAAIKAFKDPDIFTSRKVVYAGNFEKRAGSSLISVDGSLSLVSGEIVRIDKNNFRVLDVLIEIGEIK